MVKVEKEGRKKVIYLDEPLNDNGSPVDTIKRNPKTGRWEVFNQMTGFDRYAKHRGFVFGDTFKEALKTAKMRENGKYSKARKRRYR